MKDLTIALENRPGALAEMGEALGRAGVSIEGGGALKIPDSRFQIPDSRPIVSELRFVTQVTWQITFAL
jgi:hypothetical protein